MTPELERIRKLERERNSLAEQLCLALAQKEKFRKCIEKFQASIEANEVEAQRLRVLMEAKIEEIKRLRNGGQYDMAKK